MAEIRRTEREREWKSLHLPCRAWGKLGGIERVSPFGSGHINDTYLVEGAGGRYILQRINTNTFQDVDG